jgi:hypothetical protein
MMKCDHLFIVANIKRAITNQSLQSSIFTVMRRHMPTEWNESGGAKFNITVVCTSSDVSDIVAFPNLPSFPMQRLMAWPIQDIDIEGARAAFCGDGKPITEQMIDQLDRDIENARGQEKKRLKQKYDSLSTQPLSYQLLLDDSLLTSHSLE